MSTSVPSPPLVKAPVVGCNAPPKGTFIVRVVAAPGVWKMNSRLLEALRAPTPFDPPLMLPDAVARIPPLSTFTTRLRSMVSVPPVVMVEPPKISEFTIVVVRVPTEPRAVAIKVPPEIQLLAAVAPVAAFANTSVPDCNEPAATSVAKFSDLAPRYAPVSETAKLVPDPPAEPSTSNQGTIPRFGELFAPD